MLDRCGETQTSMQLLMDELTHGRTDGRPDGQGPVSSKRLRQNFVLEDVLGRFKDKNRVSSNSRNLGSSQILS